MIKIRFRVTDREGKLYLWNLEGATFDQETDLVVDTVNNVNTYTLHKGDELIEIQTPRYGRKQ